MTNGQRRKFEMFLRVRDFFTARAAMFPADSMAGTLFAALLAIISQLEKLSADKVSVLGEEGQARNVKGDARDFLDGLLQDIADITASLAYEINGLEDKFRLPRSRSVQNLIAAGRAFATDAPQYKAQFTNAGLDSTFIEDLIEATDQLEAAYSSTDTATQERVGTNAAFVPLFKDGSVIVNRLNPIIRKKFRGNAADFAAWVFASHIERPPKKKDNGGNGEGGNTLPNT